MRRPASPRGPPRPGPGGPLCRAIDRQIEELKQVLELEVRVWRRLDVSCRGCSELHARFAFRRRGSAGPFLPACSGRCFLRAVSPGPGRDPAA